METRAKPFAQVENSAKDRVSFAMTLCPELSQKTIERALKKLTDEGKIVKIGAGKSTTYVDVKRR